MNKFFSRNSSIHVIARGLLFQGENIVLCRVKDKKWFFLPGGHVEDGESARNALLRELNEEIGEGKYNITSFLGVCENIFSLEDSLLQHEINVVFRVEVPEDLDIYTKEGHIEFVIIEKNSLQACKLLPEPLKQGLLEWLKESRPFLKEIE